MRRFINGIFRISTLVPLLVILTAGILAGVHLLSNGQIAIITSALSIVAGVLILAGYLPAFIYAVRRRHRVEEQNFDLGVMLVFTALMLWAFWRAAFVILGSPDWMIGHWFPSLTSVIASMSSFYFLNVPGVSRVGLRFTTIAIIGVIGLSTVGLLLLDGL